MKNINTDDLKYDTSVCMHRPTQYGTIKIDFKNSLSLKENSDVYISTSNYISTIEKSNGKVTVTGATELVKHEEPVLKRFKEEGKFDDKFVDIFTQDKIKKAEEEERKEKIKRLKIVPQGLLKSEFCIELDGKKYILKIEEEGKESRRMSQKDIEGSRMYKETTFPESGLALATKNAKKIYISKFPYEESTLFTRTLTEKTKGNITSISGEQLIEKIQEMQEDIKRTNEVRMEILRKRKAKGDFNEEITNSDLRKAHLDSMWQRHEANALAQAKMKKKRIGSTYSDYSYSDYSYDSESNSESTATRSRSSSSNSLSAFSDINKGGEADNSSITSSVKLEKKKNKGR